MSNHKESAPLTIQEKSELDRLKLLLRETADQLHFIIGSSDSLSVNGTHAIRSFLESLWTRDPLFVKILVDFRCATTAAIRGYPDLENPSVENIQYYENLASRILCSGLKPEEVSEFAVYKPGKNFGDIHKAVREGRFEGLGDTNVECCCIARRLSEVLKLKKEVFEKNLYGEINK